jgi:hypothetical protein
MWSVRSILFGTIVSWFALAGAWLCIAAGQPDAVEASPPPAWWVWNRTTSLTAEEAATIQRHGVKELQWNLGTLTRKGTQWTGAEKLYLPARVKEVSIIPVVRLHHAPATIAEPAADEALAELLSRLCGRLDCKTLQLDYDCPDRLLPRYAEALSKVRKRIAPVRLSVTALAGWPRVAGFEELCASADELVPMFYDLEENADAERRAPLLSDTTVREQIPLWARCTASWRAGLPNFTRVTVLDAEDKTLGHVDTWRWETLVYNPAWEVRSTTTLGMTELRARTASKVGRNPVAQGGGLLVRWPDLKVLQAASESARAAGARGVVLFKLPQADSPSGWSLSTVLGALNDKALKELLPAPQDFRLLQEESRLTLVHQGSMDLPPRLGPASRDLEADSARSGWSLELDLPPAALAEFTAGDFAGRDTQQEQKTGHVVVQLPHLRSGGSLRSGYFQYLHPPAVLRWRIPQLSPLWQTAAPSH